MTITVRAKPGVAFEAKQAVGFIRNKRRYAGDVFELDNHNQMGRWMEEIDPKTGKLIDTKGNPKKSRKPSFSKSKAKKLNVDS